MHIHHALETGATGVQIPSISSVQDAADAAVETSFIQREQEVQIHH